MINNQANENGLRDKDIDFLLRCFENIPAIEKVIFYKSISKDKS